MRRWAVLIALILASTCAMSVGLAAPRKLARVKLSGSATQAGRQYGTKFRGELTSFIDMLRNDHTLNWSAMRKKSATYDRFVKKYTPVSSDFVSGMSRGAKIDRADLVTLLLHEEIVHHPHCTGIAAGAQKPVVGQTWDWPPRYAPFGGVVDYNLKGGERVLSYHFPGLWSTSGVNSKGLSLMWTGVGYYPMVKPKPGVPTYAIISELLQQKDLKSALSLLERIPNAGSFSFLLADKKGIAVAEGTPGKVEVKRDEDLILRANHYELPNSKRSAKQRLGRNDETVLRRARVEKLTRTELARGALDVKAVQRILGDHPIITDYQADNATIATMVADPARRALHVTPGGVTPGRPTTYRLPLR